MRIILMIIAVLLILSGVFYFGYTYEEIEIEDISSYNITDRYDCAKIKSYKFYNDCLEFYNNKTPYKPGDIIIPMARIE